MKTLLDELKKINAELEMLAEYQRLMERRVQKVFKRMEAYIKRGESDGESE